VKGPLVSRARVSQSPGNHQGGAAWYVTSGAQLTGAPRDPADWIWTSATPRTASASTNSTVVSETILSTRSWARHLSWSDLTEGDVHWASGANVAERTRMSVTRDGNGLTPWLVTL